MSHSVAPALGGQVPGSRLLKGGRSVSGLRLAILLLIAATLAAAGGFAWDHWGRAGDAPSARPENLRPAFGPNDFSSALAAVDQRVIGARGQLAAGPREWMRIEALSVALVSRYRLTGDLADLAEADKLIDQALAIAPDPAGPTLTRATVSLMLHRLDDTAAALDRFDRQVVPPPPHERADALAMRGDMAFQRGDMGRAEALYGEARGLSDTPGIQVRHALLLARTGRMDEARRLIETALLAPGQQPAVLADLALQRAALAYATGDWAEAGRWIKAAQDIFPGRWMTQAWAAQQRAIEGDMPGAIADYARIAGRTGKPEVMDALAYLLRLQGRGTESRDWASRSGQAWAERMAQFPAAFAQHAAEHELALGSPQKALALARRDAAARPYGQALVPLARAETLSGNPAGALETLRRAEATGWRTGLLAMEKAAALDALGRGEEAGAARKAALAHNPRLTDPAALYIWFGHE